ncbi:MAG: porin [Rhodocyclaceae bacterium]|nr:porin [Rhodocyclaceae bacterium]
MQKKIIALAVAGLVSGAAFAQSNVTIYGAADVTFDNVKAGGADVSGFNLPGRNRVSANSSFLGFKGVEDLGGGLKAVFQFEGGVANDSAGSFNFNRDSFVAVAGGFGTVAAGILTGPTRGLGAAMDPFAGATGITANSAIIGKLGGERLAPSVATINPNTGGNVSNALAGNCAASSTCTSIFDTRWNNAIAYISPNISGLTITAAYVANENKTRDGVAAANKLNTWGYDVGLKYENGPIMAALTQNQAKLGDNNGTKATDTRLGAKYNFGMGTVGLLWDRVEYKDNGAVIGSSKRNAWFLPVTFNVGGNGKVVAQYGHAGDVKGGNRASNESGAKMFAIGYEHSLSKRTIVKAVWSQVTNERVAYYDFGINATGNADTGFDPKGFQVGVRHTF